MEYSEFERGMAALLEREGFSPGGEDGFFAEECRAAKLFYRWDGAVFHVTLVSPGADGGEAVATLRQRCDALAERMNFRHFIVYNIVAAPAITPELTELVDSGEEYFEQPFYVINYAVPLGEGRVGINKRQPYELSGMKRIIRAASGHGGGEPTSAPAVLPASGRDMYSVYAIMLIDLVMLVLIEINGGSRDVETLLRFGAMDITRFVNGEYWRIATAAFVHIGFAHWLYNMLSLFIFGGRYERLLGTGRFLMVFLLSAVVGNFLNSLFSVSSVLAGASGGIFGLIGACLAVTWITKRRISGLSSYMLAVFAVVGLIIGLADPEIGNIAHFTGFVTGLLLGLPVAYDYNKRLGKDDRRQVADDA
ncbi:MAG: rhomboid family intramembrane serine protease [Clostridiales bacterium]|jgi:membrane associated rhomboid family serine protease|nr:rhomboid family intramembrane serine protease [Clostridiales bacterium]